ncbi:helix-turn-helix transcriptional regulator [Oryzomonas rubra]|uniref:DNA-binding protein n=1 Tax=Oryzomonas rubra TaxID=2509454 RepID=A0A5A9X528_9BACT|nr:helix-turn-helix domain-containing protein [Oryzomonas rubra]KAA0888096.1 DNA-binding protein [Oryzomonas rubra]
MRNRKSNADGLEVVFVTDICEVLQVERQTLYAWFRSGKYPFLRRIGGNRIGTTRGELKNFIEGKISKHK